VHVSGPGRNGNPVTGASATSGCGGGPSRLRQRRGTAKLVVMLRTIRARLILSYLFLALLTVSVVAVLSWSLVQRHIEGQEAAHLSANAAAVARQARELVWPLLRQAELQELAEASAYLGDARVRILGSARAVLADSGAPHLESEFVWMPSDQAFDIPGLPTAWGRSGWPFAVGLVPLPLSELDPDVLERLSGETVLTHILLEEDAWGRRITFRPYVQGNLPQRPVAKRADLTQMTRSVSVVIGDAARPLGYVELSSGRDTGAQALATLRRALLWAAAGAVGVAVLLGLLVGSGLTGRDEIAQLSQQFNAMAKRLERSFAELAAERDTLRRFIADASHELRTPITALKSFNSLLQGAAADDEGVRAEFLSESQSQLQRLEWITRNLLDLSRLDAGLMALQRGDHGAGDLIEAVVGSFAARVEERGIDLRLHYPPEPLTITCDRAWVEMALSNLVDNALKFAPRAGQVDVGARATDLGVEIWVTDNGPGIPPEDLPHIFDRFYRGKGTPNEGSGLGLAIVRSIAQAHGGQVTVESTPSAGARFAIVLPEE